jgi:hypothetical protein
MLALCGFIAGTLLAKVQLAYGVDAFKKEFESMYVKKEPATDAEKSLLAAVQKAKCNVCHAGKSKKNHNEYGKALKTLLTKKDAKNTEKIHGALEKVADMKSQAGNDGSPTFGELIKQGKLPCVEPTTTTASAGN